MPISGVVHLSIALAMLVGIAGLFLIAKRVRTSLQKAGTGQAGRRTPNPRDHAPELGSHEEPFDGINTALASAEASPDSLETPSFEGAPRAPGQRRGEETWDRDAIGPVATHERGQDPTARYESSHSGTDGEPSSGSTRSLSDDTYSPDQLTHDIATDDEPDVVGLDENPPPDQTKKVDSADRVSSADRLPADSLDSLPDDEYR